MNDIQLVEINKIIPYENNPRFNDDAVEKVAASLREFGFRQPIVVDKDMVIIAGHTRLKAAESLGMKEVPVLIADDMTEEQVKAYRLADNKTAEFASWDFGKLEEELADIDIDMSEFGFSDADIDSFFDEGPDEIKPEPEEKYKIVCICNSEEEKTTLVEWCKENNIQCEE